MHDPDVFNGAGVRHFLRQQPKRKLLRWPTSIDRELNAVYIQFGKNLR